LRGVQGLKLLVQVLVALSGRQRDGERGREREAGVKEKTQRRPAAAAAGRPPPRSSLSLPFSHTSAFSNDPSFRTLKRAYPALDSKRSSM